VVGLEELRVLAPRPDLGARALVPEWRKLFAREGLKQDALDGLLIASILLPLSLWLAAESGAPAETGIVAAVIGSVVCVIFGGTHAALSGPGLTTALLVSDVTAEHGMGTVGAVVIAAGALQLATGALGLGRFVRLVPIPVIRGVVVGTGALMLLLHLPNILGIPLGSGTVVERFDTIGEHLPRTNGSALAIAVASGLFALIGAFKRTRIYPGAFVGVLVPTIVVAAFGLDMPMLETGGDLPAIGWPRVPSQGFAELALVALALWLHALLGTLTSTIALEKSQPRETDPDQELIGQGLAGVLSGLAGCLPPTQLIARSAIAIRYEVTSRRPALVQALVVLIAGAAAWPFLDHVPVAALTGAVFLAAVPLFDPRPIRDVLRASRFELLVLIVTAAGIALFGIVQGLESGLALAVLAATFRLARTRALFYRSDASDAPHQVSFSGPITFFATLELRRLARELTNADASSGLVIDLRSVVAMDATGAEQLLSVVRAQKAREMRVALLGASPALKTRLLASAHPGELDHMLATSAREIEPILEKSASHLARPHLLAGIERFKDEMRGHYDSLFDQLADGQHPHTMFITCADSRISPSLLMGAHPGDLFIVRCIGALVSPPEHDHMPQEGAAIEYGVGVLGVRHVIVCGHSKCGAINALKEKKLPPELATLGKWAEHADKVAGDLSEFPDGDTAARAATVRQLAHIKAYPLVKERLESGALEIHAWFYDLSAVELLEYEEKDETFKVLGSKK
jgi:carbonic anhydrase